MTNFFVPTRSAGLTHLERFAASHVRDYAAFRNFDRGQKNHNNVSTLSPWIRHRLVLEQEVVQHAVAVHGADSIEKFIQEVCWRTYWKGWLERRPDIYRQYRSALTNQLNRVEASQEVAANLRSAETGRTGIDCFDYWIKELVESGYLHNHSRMWFASIWIFTLGLPWELGADFFMRHLLDGDAASNTLSWRWVAGLQTRGKHYLARAENIARFTDGRFNPVGQLREDAPALEFIDHPTALAPPIAIPHSIDDSTALLITDDDLFPESLFPDNMPCVSLITTRDRAAGQVSELVSVFVQSAIEDALERQHDSSPCRLGTNAADDLIVWCEANNVTQLVTAHCPTGPARDMLDELAGPLDVAGISLAQVPRKWDRLFWAHSDRGFFAFRKHIPAVLDELKSLG